MIKKLHHNAYRCRDSEETRKFYEDFLGLPPRRHARDQGDEERAHHSTPAYVLRLDDGSYLAFFEAPDMPFEFKTQHDFDLHIALEVEETVLKPMMAKGSDAGIESRGISDHGFIHSIYFRDPNGYVIELTANWPDTTRRWIPRPTGRARSSTSGRPPSRRRQQQSRLEAQAPPEQRSTRVRGGPSER